MPEEDDIIAIGVDAKHDRAGVDVESGDDEALNRLPGPASSAGPGLTLHAEGVVARDARWLDAGALRDELQHGESGEGGDHEEERGGQKNASHVRPGASAR